MNRILVKIIVICFCYVIHCEANNLDDIPCDQIDKSLYAPESGTECTNQGHLGIVGSCKQYKSCSIPPSSNQLQLSEVGICPDENMYNIEKRICQPGHESDKCPQKRCFKKESHQKPDIYSQRSPITVPPGRTTVRPAGRDNQQANNKATSSVLKFELLSFVLSVLAVFTAKLL